MNGLLLAFQFFTIVPIRKELPMGKKEVTMMYCLLPVVGLFIGLSMVGVFYVSATVLAFSPLFTAVLLVLSGVVLTGGLHADGWADTADAFFSYQTPDKRFEVLDDPRLGAFGTMALIFLVGIKVVLVYEMTIQQNQIVYAFIFIPILARALLSICFIIIPAAKNKGIAFFFKEKMHNKPVIFTSVFLVFLVLVLYAVFFQNLFSTVFLAFILFGSVSLFKRWTIRQFKGVTGDLAGAYIEGMEIVLWGTALWLL